MKTLLIVESPHKAKVIEGFLDNSYIVRASVGHIRMLPEPKNMTAKEKEIYGNYAVNTKSKNFDPLFKNDPKKASVIKDLKTILSKVDELILMTDDDAEGHAISYHLLEVLNPKIPTYRATTHEITKDAVNLALKNKELIDQKNKTPKLFYGLAESAITRGIWDRLYGYSTSPYLWKVIKTGTSSGRVQTAGLKIVVEREEKRLNFTSINFYTIKGLFNNSIEGVLTEFNNEKIANSSHIDENGKVKEGYVLITDKNVNEIIKSLNEKDYFVEDVKNKPYKRVSPPPFTTSSALQSIGAKTRMSSKQITNILQSLYQNGDITYIRTVSISMADEAIDAVRKTVSETWGKNYLSSQRKVYKDKKEGNSGHECIRPTLNKDRVLNKSFTDKQINQVFSIIRQRTLATQAKDCVGITWTAIISSKDKTAIFSASETEITDPGWTVIYKQDDEEEKVNND